MTGGEFKTEADGRSDITTASQEKLMLESAPILRSLIVKVDLYVKLPAAVVPEMVTRESELSVSSPLVLLQVKSTETGVLT